MTKFIAFMAHIPHDQVDYLEDTLREYLSCTQYIIAMELSPEGETQHFHFLTDMSLEDYHRYAQRVFRQKYQLRGQAKPGLARQYGKLREIHDFERMAAYTVKDGNIRTNMNPADIQLFVERSFRKTEKLQFKTKLFAWLSTLKTLEAGNLYDLEGSASYFNQPIYRPPHKLRLDIRQSFRSNTTNVPSRSLLNTLVADYMMYYKPDLYDLHSIDSWICGGVSVEQIIV